MFWGCVRPAALAGLLAAGCSLILLSLAGCGTEDSSPEEQIRAYIAEGEAAVEARDLLAFQELISPDYSDDHGRTRRDLRAIAANYFLRHQSIHIFTDIHHIDLDSRDGGEVERAEVMLYVAAAGSPISGVEQLLSMRADLHRFEIQLGRNGDREWRLEQARWHRATKEDFLRDL